MENTPQFQVGDVIRWRGMPETFRVHAITRDGRLVVKSLLYPERVSTIAPGSLHLYERVNPTPSA